MGVLLVQVQGGMAWSCRRAGCLHVRVGGEHRQHGYCCNACRRGDTNHTRNCTGFFQCRRPFCPFAHGQSPRRHGYCCNVCRRGESRHTHNCTGRGEYVVRNHIGEAGVPGAQAEQCPAACSAAPRGQQHERGEGLRLPEEWKRGDLHPWTYALWFLDRYELRFETGVRECWENLSERLPRVETGRSLRLYAFARGESPLGMPSINVHDRNLDARAHGLYSLGHVTGFDFRVQAKLLTTGDTVCALLEAVETIEARGSLEFAFQCRSGTHRSVACCVLLAAIVYPEAQIWVTTDRTWRAAAEHGLVGSRSGTIAPSGHVLPLSAQQPRA